MARHMLRHSCFIRHFARQSARASAAWPSDRPPSFGGISRASKRRQAPFPQALRKAFRENPVHQAAAAERDVFARAAPLPRDPCGQARRSRSHATVRRLPRRRPGSIRCASRRREIQHALAHDASRPARRAAREPAPSSRIAAWPSKFCLAERRAAPAAASNSRPTTGRAQGRLTLGANRRPAPPPRASAKKRAASSQPSERVQSRQPHAPGFARGAIAARQRQGRQMAEPREIARHRGASIRRPRPRRRRPARGRRARRRAVRRRRHARRRSRRHGRHDAGRAAPASRRFGEARREIIGMQVASDRLRLDVEHATAGARAFLVEAKSLGIRESPTCWQTKASRPRVTCDRRLEMSRRRPSTHGPSAPRSIGFGNKAARAAHERPERRRSLASRCRRRAPRSSRSWVDDQIGDASQSVRASRCR